MSGKRNDPEQGKTKEISLKDFKMSQKSLSHEPPSFRLATICFRHNTSVSNHAYLHDFSQGTEKGLLMHFPSKYVASHKSNSVQILFLPPTLTTATS